MYLSILVCFIIILFLFFLIFFKSLTVLYITVFFLFAFLVTVICHIFKFNFCLYCDKNKFCLDKILFTNFKKDSSKKNAILLVFFMILIILNYIINIYNIFLSEKITCMESLEKKYTFHIFWDSVKNNYDYLLTLLDILILMSYISSFSINKFIEKIFPLKDGIDKNSQEENTIVRFGTWCKIINSLTDSEIKKASEIGEEFGRSIDINSLDLNNKEHVKILEERWNKTDSELARFYQRIILNSFYNSEIILEIIEPFWSKDFHNNCNIPLERYPDKKGRQPITCLHKICAFNYYYMEGVLKNAKNFETFSIKCLQNNRKCYLLSDKKCIFIIKTKNKN